MESIVADQIKTAEAIKRIHSNMKKDSASRKTSEYCLKKLELLEEEWKYFNESHNTLRTELPEKHEYFTKDIYGQAEKIYNQALAHLTKIQEKIQEEQETNAPKPSHTPMIREQISSIALFRKDLKKIARLIENGENTELLKLKQQFMEKRWTEIISLEVKINATDTAEAKSYTEEGHFEIASEQYEELQIKLLASMKPENASATPRLNLSGVTIPIFAGHYDAWPNFRDLFTQLVDKNQSFGTAEKMQLLKTNLRGEAAKIIQHLETSSLNYEAAWNLIEERYNNPRLIFSKHMENLLNFTNINTESAGAIKKMHDTIRESTEAIKNMQITEWKDIIAYIMLRKLDSASANLYEQTVNKPRGVQQLDDLVNFLGQRFQTLEAIKTNNKKAEVINNRKYNEHPKIYSHHAEANKCKLCETNHELFRCEKFIKYSVEERANFISRYQICKNCLSHNNLEECRSRFKCQKCNRRHHTLLHDDDISARHQRHKQNRGYNKPQHSSHDQPSNRVNAHLGNATSNYKGAKAAVLSTALVKVVNGNNEKITLRALIDTGSQASFITTAAAQALDAPKIKQNAEISGLDATTTRSRWRTNIIIRPRFDSDFEMNTELIILPKITSVMPSTYIYTDNDWNNMVLADPEFNIPRPIDVLLGIDYFKYYMNAGFKIMEDGLVAQNTEFGWIISGTAPASPNLQIVSMITNVNEDVQLTKFWEMEEVELHNEETGDNNHCEEFYKSTYKRNEDGTYTVKLPYKKNTNELGESKKKAAARLMQLEKKFATNKHLEKMYKDFMQEYLSLGHMKLVNDTEKLKYYIPHQPVLREDKETTKLRVVFDASSKTSTGLSLNDILHVGPKLQQDLLDILIRWRKHKIVLTADIEKMYRMIRMDPEDQLMHTILWRFNKEEPMQEYQLTTVTYGTAPASYLAIKTMQQLAEDEREEFPLASNIILNDFYVDDLLTGANSTKEAEKIQLEVTELLRKGGLNIRKWRSNTPIKQDTDLKIENKDATVKTLGILWSSKSDEFKYEIKTKTENTPTKRKILSEIAAIFDPLGLLSPVTVRAKMIMQEIWQCNLNWDDTLPTTIQSTWNTITDELKALEEIHIPRWIHCEPNQPLEIHGFCDASLKAYGAVIYTKIIETHGKTHISLLTSKSKVAPLKNKMTIPRLELCAATLLAKLIKRCITSLKHDNVIVYAWSDSKVVLAWLNADPGKWRSFVANRVQEIHKNLGRVQWNYTTTKENPADLVSRGLLPSSLKSNYLWWNGPHWLKNPTSEIIEKSQENVIPNITEEMKTKIITSLIITKENDMLTKFSSWPKMIRIIAYCQRFFKPQNRKPTISLDPEELQESKELIIKLVQKMHFAREWSQLKKGEDVEKSSRLRTLNPFIDKKGIIRVGGRLHNSELNYTQKHPAILPTKGHITDIIIRDGHIQILHGGNQATINYIRQEYWIPQLKKKTRQIIQRCVTCTRYRSNTQNQLMGVLPKPRVTPSHPFTHTGIDYAGPIALRTSRGRGIKSYKGYIAIFICLSTKAIHIEAVSDLTTNAFIAAFRRFTSRRGICTDVYSDNGTNFVGAKRLLDKELKDAIDENAFKKAVALESVKWHFIPPASPHFGGLWEAGVKSIKHHLKRVIGNHTLTYEEMATLLCQIEACLNSRPLTPLTDNADDIDVLTPGHFLIGQPLKAHPEMVQTLNDQPNMKNRWTIIQKMKGDFWKKWCTEYLTRLQHRTKWTNQRENVEEGDIVLIKQENINPNEWPLARVIHTHCGDDGLVRVATLRTRNKKEITRPITKLCKIPTDETRSEKEEKAKPYKGSQQSTSSTPPKGIFALLTILTLITPLRANFTTKQLQPGLYIEHMGHAYISAGSLELKLNIPMDQVTRDRRNAIEISRQFQKMCDKAHEHTKNTHCRELEHHLNETRKECSMLIDRILHLSMRNKRGLLGNLMTSIFGVNDEVYRDIDAIESNQQHLIDVTNHQAKIMVSTIATINSSEERINIKLENVRRKLNDGIKIINEMHEWYKMMDPQVINIQTIMNFQLALNYLEEISTKYNKLNKICDHQGHINEFIPSLQLERIFANAERKIPSDITILRSPIRKMEITKSEQGLYMKTYFHLLQKRRYDLIKSTPVPARKKGHLFTEPVIVTPFLGVEYNTQKYFEITEYQIQKATKISSTEYICNPGIVKSMENQPNCILDEIYKKQDKSACTFIDRKIEDITWKELNKPNSWLFTVYKATSISIICDGVREEVVINETGIIYISPHCLIQTKQITLRAKLFDDISAIATFSKPMEINFISSKLSHTPPEIPLEPESARSDEISKLQEEESDLGQQLSNYHWRKTIPYTTAIQFVMTIIVISLMVLGYLLMKKWKQYKANGLQQQTPPDQVTTEIEMQPLYSDVPSSSQPSSARNNVRSVHFSN